MEKNHYICIPAIDIDSVLKIDKKAYPQAYLEECKYKLKKRKTVSFIDSEIIDDDDDDDDMMMIAMMMKLLMMMLMTVIMKIIFNILFFSKYI